MIKVSLMAILGFPHQKPRSKHWTHVLTCNTGTRPVDRSIPLVKNDVGINETLSQTLQCLRSCIRTYYQAQ